MYFQLLSLPHLAIAQIFNGMLTQELLELVSDRKDLQRYCHAIGLRSGGFNIALNEFGFSIDMVNLGFSSNEGLFSYKMDIPTLMDRFFKSFEYVQKTFPGEIQNLEVCPIIFSKHLHLIPKECSVLTIGNKEMEDIDYLEVCSDEVLQELINQTNFKHGLVLEGPLELKTENQKIFNIEYLKISRASWITSSILRQLQNRMMYLNDVTFSDEAVNEFLKNTHSNLEFAQFTNDHVWDMEKILDGLDAIFVEKQQIPIIISKDDPLKSFIPMEIEYGWDLYDTYDVIRSDGTRITVKIDTHSICIYVWKNKESE